MMMIMIPEQLLHDLKFNWEGEISLILIIQKVLVSTCVEDTKVLLGGC